MRKSIKPEVNGNLAMAIEPKMEEVKIYSKADKEAYLANTREVNGVCYGALPVEILKVDTYQRCTQKNVRKIAANWDSAKAGTITVSYRDGEFWVVDGRNRFAAAKMAGIGVLQCQILTNMTRGQERIAFADQGANTIKLTIAQRFNALADEGDSETDKPEIRDAVMLKKALDEHHVRFTGSTDKKSGDIPVVTGPSALLRLYNKYGINGVNWVLDTIETIGWHNDYKAYCDAVIRALGNVYGAHEDVEKVQTMLARDVNGYRNTPCQVITQAMADRPGRGPTVALTQLFESLVRVK